MVALVGLVSSYREGPLLAAALRSLQPAVDRIYVCEGPAGIEDADFAAAPPSSIERVPCSYRRGSWETDAAKRTAMLTEALAADKRRPLWGVWLDGDELLVNGSELRAQAQWAEWESETDNPLAGLPLRLVEMDGTCSLTLGRFFRLDLVRRFVLSNLIVETVNGDQRRLGNVPETLELEEQAREAFPGRRIVPPPLPGEPVIVHRSHLRHPLRRGLRLHEQESELLARLETG